MHQAMKDSSAQHESRPEIPEDPNESEKTPAPAESVMAEPNPNLMHVSKDLRSAFQMIDMSGNAGADFNYDHRMLIPKKIIQATKKSLMTNYRRSVLCGESYNDRSLNIN